MISHSQDKCSHSAPPPQGPTVLVTLLDTLPAQLRRSLTWDQDEEMGAPPRIRFAVNIAVSRCNPHSWQRGTNENINGLPQPILAQRHRSIGAHAEDLTGHQQTPAGNG